ncbi:hypothetical protein K3172_11315 [Qipengyuania sp. 6B39]|uniref:hypothetical protein n=1 Tax=Qipengyuania proteolytica TaxID=2867239 RepID=UPI001C88FED9|nr:hypothetical protein [Qipengyuania proteolytica]MBX7496443.1 hypothetical protein [Qipengyuania proteolytica]
MRVVSVMGAAHIGVPDAFGQTLRGDNKRRNRARFLRFVAFLDALQTVHDPSMNVHGLA